MLIIPFIHKTTIEKDMNIHNIRILTIGGKDIWDEPNSDIDYILHSNDIYYKNIIKNGDLYFCEVDIEKTNIHDMYKWNEIDINDDTFCWRDYIYIVGKNREFWLNHPKDEKIGSIYVNKMIQIIGI